MSPCHSISIGFDVAPVGRPRLRFPRADLLSRARRRPHGLSDAVSDRTRSCAPTCSSIATWTTRGCARCAHDAARGAVRADAGPAQADRRHRGDATSRSGRSISTSAPAIGRPASCWSATPSRPRARRPAPAATRCSPTWSGSATSTFRAGSRATGMGADKIAAFYDDEVKVACDDFATARRTICARSRPKSASPGRRGAGSSSSASRASARCARRASACRPAFAGRREKRPDARRVIASARHGYPIGNQETANDVGDFHKIPHIAAAYSPVAQRQSRRLFPVRSMVRIHSRGAKFLSDLVRAGGAVYSAPHGRHIRDQPLRRVTAARTAARCR